MTFHLESPHAPEGFHSFEWATPPSVFHALDSEFHFTLDACASEANAKCSKYFDIATDGLLQDWSTERVWCNPPYGRGQIDRWVRKAYEESRRGALVVMLLPNSTDTAWFHNYCMKGEVRFLRGRLRFGGANGTPQFGSVVVIFRPEVKR